MHNHLNLAVPEHTIYCVIDCLIRSPKQMENNCSVTEMDNGYTGNCYE